ncbi:hypothetical protein H4R19_005409 [Coemansia spiralis]|nr:hypothetical protein H4R19_005409 [Coemansia spiralis]
MGAPELAMPWVGRRSTAQGDAAPRVVFSGETLSATKRKALRRVARRRAVLLAGELALFAVLLALLIMFSFRLTHKSDNRYARWSSSWVLILLSVFMVLVGLAVFVTGYFFRERRRWIVDPATTDNAVVDGLDRDSGIRRWGLFRYCGPGRRQPMQPQREEPWLQPQARNSRAWRAMQARQRALSDSSANSSDGRLLPPPPRLSPRRPGPRRAPAA